MKQIDCYYIKGNGKDSKCYKIHGVGIVYNTARSIITYKTVGVVSGMIGIPTIVGLLGLGVGKGFVSSLVDVVR